MEIYKKVGLMRPRPTFFLAIKDLSQRKREVSMVMMVIMTGIITITIMYSINNGVQDIFIGGVIDVETGHLKVLPEGVIIAGQLVISEEETGQISEGRGDVIKNTESKVDKIESLPGVIGVAPRISDGAGLYSKTKLINVPLLGIWPSKEVEATALGDCIFEGEFLDDKDRFKLLIGNGLANNMKVEVGDHLHMRMPDEKTYDFEVKGILKTSSVVYDSYMVFIPYEVAQDITGKNEASEIVIKLEDMSKADDMKLMVKKETLSNRVHTWKELSASTAEMFSTLAIVNNITAAMSIMASAIAVGLLTYTTVKNKTRGIGMLKAIGAKNLLVLRVFLVEAMFIGVIGVFIGTAIGLIVINGMQESPMIISPQAGMEVAIVPRISYEFILLIDLAIFLACILGSALPALIASRINIIKAIWHG